MGYASAGRFTVDCGNVEARWSPNAFCLSALLSQILQFRHVENSQFA